MTSDVHITLTARDIRPDDMPGKAAVVIDVLRATSTLVTALSNGALWVRTVATVEEALALRSPEVLLGGERHADRIPGFDLGNSPLEYTPGRVAGKGIVLTTTNGTQAIAGCGGARQVLIGSFLNHQALAAYLLETGLPVELVCAGTNGEFSLDDYLCAGWFCTTICDSGKYKPDDMGRLAMQAWRQVSDDLHQALDKARHYNILLEKGLKRDLDYCLNLDAIPLVIALDQDDAFRVVPQTGLTV